MPDFFQRDDETPLKRQADRETHGDSHRAAPPWKEGDRLGGFVLERLLGSGSSGFVYRVLEIDTGARFALKVLRQGDPNNLLRNRLGFRRMMQIDHPNLVRVDRIYKLGIHTALAMEEVDGVTFVQAIRQLKALPREEAFARLLDLMRDFAAGLSVMHAAGFVHRDIKPQNLMVDSAGRGRVIDYGLVDVFEFDQGSAEIGSFILGTPHYLAPEVIYRQSYLPAGDIFALGIVMLESLQAIASGTRAHEDAPHADGNHAANSDIQNDRGASNRDSNDPSSNTPRDESSQQRPSQQRPSQRGNSQNGDQGVPPIGESLPERDPGTPGLKRNEASRIDAELILHALDNLNEHVPEVISDTCRQMLDRQPSERPTAMRLARLGLPPKVSLPAYGHQPLIGRDETLSDVVQWVDSIFAGGVSRIHITGPSGIGKTRFLDEVIAYIESKNWGQVFRGRCRQREDSALQAFEQICDAIANRYMCGDRDRIQLDSVSYGLLAGIFPVLGTMMESRLDLPPLRCESPRRASLQAVIRMSHQLQAVGPLFIVIDDAQWADRDSLNVLDRLQTSTSEVGMGVITISREPVDLQSVIADKSITLGPIDQSHSMDCLRRSAQRWAIPITEQALSDLADAASGSPLRLLELANEFRPGGAFSELDFDTDPDCSVTEMASINQLWRSRCERLSDDAKQVLLYVVTAGGRVSMAQLGELTGQHDDVDAAVTELARLRLIIDDATGGECISIFHDRFAEQVISSLGDASIRGANEAWASLLVRMDNPESLAARIAGHWFAAGHPGRAISHAILAAEDAERRIAKSEAARWHSLVIDHVTGNEKTHHIRQAARCYHEADILGEAARYYQLLADFVEPHEQFECRLAATTLLVRCGRFARVREQLGELAVTLGLPRPKSAWRAKLSLIYQMMRAKMQQGTLAESLLAMDPASLDLATNPPTPPKSTSQTTTAKLKKPDSNQPDSGSIDSGQLDSRRISAGNGNPKSGIAGLPTMGPAYSPSDSEKHRRQQQRFELCAALVRPISMFDTLYATELSFAAANLARRMGNFQQRMHVAVGEAVMECYDKTPRRGECLGTLLRLLPLATRSKDPMVMGDVWAGLTFTHFLSCRWDQTQQPLSSSVDNYQKLDSPRGFEIAHIRWVQLWSNWHLGQWSEMQLLSEVMFDEAIQQRDLLQQQITIGGLGGNTWLAQDRSERLSHLREKASDPQEMGSGGILYFLADLSEVNQVLYEGRWQQAWEMYESCQQRNFPMPCGRLQVFRISCDSTGALIALHCRSQDPSIQWTNRIVKRIATLRSEQLRYSRVLANFYDGLLCWQQANEDSDPQQLSQAVDYLTQAQNEAAEAHLRPIQLAAADKLAEIETGNSLHLLADRMREQGVVAPEKLRRLYTLDE
ncbi:Serine/threonine-protein kinase PknA [Rubripirellula lacrimiformis]|uniref:Serine/threonine-protein kinase PknA n=1 Tax=Rubripirellula lacrimiformis TaxID=1930273 RepID=A0A517NG24_9BACT|nr:serine/threonine-protein kinase [Rubripirellula lacrimiformis]QDT06082.1 Serine/threonine-protein kinase PknA [Rubripirellula lacrimiformis]